MSEIKNWARFAICLWFLMEGLISIQEGNSEFGGIGVLIWSFYCLWAGGELQKRYGSSLD